MVLCLDRTHRSRPLHLEFTNYLSRVWRAQDPGGNGKRDACACTRRTLCRSITVRPALETDSPTHASNSISGRSSHHDMLPAAVLDPCRRSRQSGSSTSCHFGHRRCVILRASCIITHQDNLANPLAAVLGPSRGDGTRDGASVDPAAEGCDWSQGAAKVAQRR